jgi:hypothetical protein
VVPLRRTTAVPPGVDLQSTHLPAIPSSLSFAATSGAAFGLAPHGLDPGAARPVNWDYRSASASIALMHIS